MNFQELTPDSRVWIYQANRLLTAAEAVSIQQDGDEFIRNWSAHGELLQADIRVFHNLFLVLFADESAVKASGCSIDSSVHWVKSMQQKYVIDLLDRMTVAYRKSPTDPLELAHINELGALYEKGEITDDTIVFNNLVATKREFEQSWQVKFADSWYHQRVVS